MGGADGSRTAGFSVDVAAGAGGAVVTVLGELDMATVPRLRRALDDAREASGDLIVDLAGCGFIDSSGIAALVGTATRLRKERRNLRIRGAHDRVRGVFELSGLAEHPAIVLEP